MFGNRSKNERLVHTVRIDVSGGQEVGKLGFCIKPPIKVIDPSFMGKDFKFTFSDSEATYGVASIPNGTEVGRYGEVVDVEGTFYPIFSSRLQTFLGKTGIRMEVVHGSGAEM